MEIATYLFDYVLATVLEGLAFAFLFWTITYITIESTSLSVAVRAALIAELVGNLPYLAGLPALSGPGLAATLVAGILFCWLIIRVGEINFGKAIYGVATTYFVLVALVSCS